MWLIKTRKYEICELHMQALAYAHTQRHTNVNHVIKFNSGTDIVSASKLSTTFSHLALFPRLHHLNIICMYVYRQPDKLKTGNSILKLTYTYLQIAVY